jgi:hypothetical protein
MSLEYVEINQIPSVASTILGADLFEIEQGGVSKQASASVISASLGFPVGGVCEWYTSTPPENCIFAQGQAILRSTYSVLFALWGTSFGVGDGTNTFNVIDKREVYAVGIGTNATVIMSAHDVFTTINEFKENRTQGFTYNANTLAGGAGVGLSYNAVDRQMNSGFIGTPVTDGVNGVPRIGATTRGNSIGCNFIIKYQ